MIEHLIVVDIDGTLANSVGREHLALAKDWDAFHEASSNDEIHQAVRWLLDRLCDASVGDTEIIALTGRPEKYRELTMAWLEKRCVDVCFDELLMRPNDDWRSDAELKPALLALYCGGMEEAKRITRFILEDRDRVVEAWRNLGFNCWQVRVGGY